ncbi:hypothetical protein P4V64_27640 [Bacillus thuringiensis]|nr:hypothetical protein [Bacillus thuringiensis]
MSKKRTVQEKTAAESKSIGFDYQYYFFLYKLLQLENGQSIGYEVKDDVHLDTNDGEQVLIQLKHTIEQRADGDIKNLTEKDDDLWKTISNWIDMINDDAEDRTTLEKQTEFINKTLFYLVTNKSCSSDNQFFKNLSDFQDNKLKINEFKEYLKELSTPMEGKAPSTVDEYIKKLIKQEDKWLKAFLGNLSILLRLDELIVLIKAKIKEKNVAANRVDYVYDAINSNLRDYMYHEIKAGKKVVLTFDDYYNRFTRYFEMARTTRRLPIYPISKKAKVPTDVKKHNSIQQLLDIEVLAEADEDFEERVVKIFTSKLHMFNHLENWFQAFEITDEQRKSFNDDTVTEWQKVFDKIHFKIKKRLRTDSIENIPQEELVELATECYFSILELKLKFDETELDTIMSNGQFYLL